MDPGHPERRVTGEGGDHPQQPEHPRGQPGPDAARHRHPHHRVQPGLGEAGEGQGEGQGEALQPLQQEKTIEDRLGGRLFFISEVCFLFFFSLPFFVVVFSAHLR